MRPIHKCTNIARKNVPSAADIQKQRVIIHLIIHQICLTLFCVYPLRGNNGHAEIMFYIEN
jgi:hypothetical protein